VGFLSIGPTVADRPVQSTTRRFVTLDRVGSPVWPVFVGFGDQSGATSGQPPDGRTGHGCTTKTVIGSMQTMRLWSLHPSLLDRKGLLALWREGLLAQKVLLGKTAGYRFHPQLKRFQASQNPIAAISTYLWAVVDEARVRGYTFDASKIAMRRRVILIPVTQGQLEFEHEHLRKKLRLRDQERASMLSTARLKPHPMLRVVAGDIEPWEAV